MQQGRPLKTSSVSKGSISFRNRKTSISLEDEFWEALNHIVQLRRTSLSNIFALIEDGRGQSNLSSAVRVFVLEYYQLHSDAERSGPSNGVETREAAS
jgi:predicted DNA-binding ribbon-helix-helix protein